MPTPNPHLIIYSHGRTPPLNPPADLQYDLRSIPNPPRQLRAVSDGRSKRLREHLLLEPKFMQKLRQVEVEIREAMERKIAEYNDRNGQLGTRNDSSTAIGAHERKSKPSDAIDQEDTSDEEVEQQYDEEENEEIVLRVGCNCALGHHRSVAFVSELSALDWPSTWNIQVIHRDLDKKRAAGTRERQKAAWRDKRNYGIGDEEGGGL